MQNNYLSREQCYELLKEYNTPPHVVRHCIKVTETALKMAEELIIKGYQLDLKLIEGAGLIHDIARVEEKHWEVGAKIAESLGHYKEAEIIRVHMKYSSDPLKNDIDEKDLICLADRMVKEDEFVGLEIRMNYILEKFKEDKESYEHIKEKLKDNQDMVDKIEKIIEKSIASLF